MDHPVHHGLIARLDAQAHAVHVVRRAGHCLLPARDDALRVARANCLRRQHHCLESGSAHLVDSHGGNGAGKAGVDHRLARWSLTRTALHDLTHDHVVDRVDIDTRAPHGLADHQCAKLRSGKGGEAAKISTDRRANGRKDDGDSSVAHETVLWKARGEDTSGVGTPATGVRG